VLDVSLDGAPAGDAEPFAENVAPVISSLSGGTISEGGTYSESGSFTDSDSSSWTATVDYGDGSGPQTLPLSGMHFSLSHQYKDEGPYTVTVKVT
jgi:large repetitive protein